MTNDLGIRTFNNETFGTIRTMQKDGEPWFVGKDVAEKLGYERGAKAIQDHVDEEDKDAVPIQDSIGRMQNTPIINESGLYALIFGSKLPAAKQFKRWVTAEVLPQIRKTGKYDPAAKAKTARVKAIEKIFTYGTYSEWCVKLSAPLTAIQERFKLADRKASLMKMYAVFNEIHGFSVEELKDARIEILREEGDDYQAEQVTNMSLLHYIYSENKLLREFMAIINDTLTHFEITCDKRVVLPEDKAADIKEYMASSVVS